MTFQDRDRQYIWHPYTQEKTADDNIIMVRGEGAYLYDEAGNRYIDACASWWTNIHGHAHPHIASRIGEQAKQLEQVIFAGFSHPTAIDLAEQLLKILPTDFAKVFYSDNGSTAVEAAIKMALQYWHNRGEARTRILCFRDAYHGDTFGSMSVSARGVFTEPYHRLLFDVQFIDTPDFENEQHIIDQFRKVVSENQQEIAAFIFEPLVLGSGGMKMYSAKLLDQLLSFCAGNNIITIADEVMTGFGRTGNLFACLGAGVEPDLICLSKGLTGGFLPMSLTVCTDSLREAFLGEGIERAFLHGHSFTGNPLGCAAANASLDLLVAQPCQDAIATIARIHAERLAALKHGAHPRQCGTIAAIDLGEGTYGGAESARLKAWFRERGMLVRPIGSTTYLLPPYCISESDLHRAWDALEAVARG